MLSNLLNDKVRPKIFFLLTLDRRKQIACLDGGFLQRGGLGCFLVAHFAPRRRPPPKKGQSDRTIPPVITVIIPPSPAGRESALITPMEKENKIIYLENHFVCLRFVPVNARTRAHVDVKSSGKEDWEKEWRIKVGNSAWKGMNRNAVTATPDVRQRPLQLQIMNTSEFPPEKMSKAKIVNSDKCWSSGASVHMFWSFPVTGRYWKNIFLDINIVRVVKYIPRPSIHFRGL